MFAKLKLIVAGGAADTELVTVPGIGLGPFVAGTPLLTAAPDLIELERAAAAAACCWFRGKMKVGP